MCIEAMPSVDPFSFSEARNQLASIINRARIHHEPVFLWRRVCQVFTDAALLGDDAQASSGHSLLASSEQGFSGLGLGLVFDLRASLMAARAILHCAF
jgi:hypothetical protein